MTTCADPNYERVLKISWLDTKLGHMVAISDEKGLYLLEFTCRRGLKQKIERLRIKTKAAIVLGSTDPIKSIALEIESYFAGELKQFQTPLHISGSLFQKLVWEELMRIPYGGTQSYMAQAAAIGKDKAYRAVANANGANQFAIVIPCHRVINNNGDLGGYGAGTMHKKWLLEHEKNNQF